MTSHFYLDDINAEKSSILLTVRSIQGAKSSMRIGTGISVNPLQWDSARERLRKNFHDSSRINNQLDRIAAAVTEYHDTAVRLLKVEPYAYIKSELLESGLLNRRTPASRSGYASRTVLDFFDQFIASKSISAAKNTIDVYKTSYKHLKNIVPARATFADVITPAFRDKYNAYLVANFTNNTIGKHIVVFKRFLYWAKEEGFHKDESFDRLFRNNFNREAPTIALTSEEVEQMASLDLSNHPGLRNSRTLFFIGIYTCLRISDVMRVDPKVHCQNGWLRMSIQKTRRLHEIPIVPPLQKILDYETWYPLTSQKFNDNLKIIGKMAGIDTPTEVVHYRGAKAEISVKPKYELIASHTARRTGITLLLQHGIESSLVMKVSGHTDPRSFQKYIKHSKKHMSEVLARAWER